jgi:hypothetical protein
LAALAEVWALSPDVRLGQLLAHLGFLGEVHFDHGLGDIEDDELIAVLKLHRGELSSRIEDGVADAEAERMSPLDDAMRKIEANLNRAK